MLTMNTPKQKETQDTEIYAELIEDIISNEKDLPTRNISNGLVDYSLRCIRGIHKSKFLYLNLTPEGELIGSNPNDPSLTVYMENSNLDSRHAQITPKNGGYYIKDLNSSTGTYIRQGKLYLISNFFLGNNDPILITNDQEIQINNENFCFQFGDEIEDEVSEWLKKYNLGGYVDKAKSLNVKSIERLAELKVTDCRNLVPNLEERENLHQAIADITIDLAEGRNNNYLLVKNLDTNKINIVGWAGAIIGNSEISDIKLSEAKNKGGIYTSLTPAECIIVFQYGKYWILNSKRNPIKELYLKIKSKNLLGSNEISEEDQELRPGDVIKIGSMMLKVNRFNVGRAEDKGNKQRMMEDKSVIIQDLAISDTLDFSFFAVFDGHGGTLCVRHVSDNLPDILREFILKSDRISNLYDNENSSDLFDNQERFYYFINFILEGAIKETDLSFFEEYNEYSLSSGCTGVIILIIGDRIICANIGDSRAILSRKKTAICLSKDHKPTNSDEKVRIKEAGGIVQAGRVNGVLSTSRAFGDYKFKVISNYADSFKHQGNGEDIVTSKPEIRVHKIDYTKDEFVVIGCDGLYDNLTNQQIIDFVHDGLSAMPIGNQDSQKVMGDLVQYAKTVNIEKTNNCDNISAILIPLTRGVEPI